MLLADERGPAFRTFICPLIVVVPCLLILLPCSLAGRARQNYLVRNLLLGILLPAVLQFGVIFLGGWVMESLEQEAEEQAHAQFVAFMAEAKNRTPPDFYEKLVDQMGDPEAVAWRNWDVFGATYFCFTLMTTIGYGTFAPVTDGGKIFACLFALVAIPFSLYLYSSLGTCFIRTLFYPCISRRVKLVRSTWPRFRDAKGADAGVDQQEMLDALDRSRIVIGKPTVRKFIQDTFAENDMNKVTRHQYHHLVGRVSDFHQGQVELVITLIVTHVFVITQSIAFSTAQNGDDLSVLDGFYWSIITFTTCGLGDLTWHYENDRSKHGSFDANAFMMHSLGLALLGAIVSGIGTLATDLWYLEKTFAMAILPKAVQDASAELQEHGEKDKKVVEDDGSDDDAPPNPNGSDEDAPPKPQEMEGTEHAL